MFTMHNHLRELAMSHNMTPTRLMVEAGVAKTAYSNLRNKPNGTISQETARKIADYLNITVDEVMGRSQKNNPATVSDDKVIDDPELYEIYSRLNEMGRQRIKDFARGLLASSED